MSSIQRRVNRDGSVRWRARVQLRGHKSTSKSFASRRAAFAWYEKTRKEIESGRGVVEQVTLGELIDRYLEVEVQSLGTAKERKARAAKLRFWKLELGAEFASRVSRPSVKAAVYRLEARGLAPATVNRYLSALSRVFSIAQNEWEACAHNPCQGVRRRRESRRELVLRDDERQALLEACSSSRNRSLLPYVLVAMQTGARQGSIARLAWRDVRFDDSRLTFYVTKNTRPLNCFMPPELATALRKWRGNVREIQGGLVFPSGFPRTAWEFARECAGLASFRYHDLRHDFCTRAAERGMSQAHLQRAMGHRTPSMTSRYTHLADDAHVRAILEDMARGRH
jgi:integrase